MRPPSHEATTAQLGALYLGVEPKRSGVARVLVGRQHSGALFCHDPFELYRAGRITNPNLIVLGQIGRGKSTFVKTFLYRQAAFGRRIVVLDPKGEYDALAAALGTRAIALRPGGTIRLNPLRAGRANSPEAQRVLALRAATAVAESVLARPLSPGEHLTLELALDAVCGASSELTLPSLVGALLDPDQRSAQVARSSIEELRREGRDLAFELRRFVSGELAGMFDGPTSRGVDLEADVVVLDLSALYSSVALGPVLACAQSVLEGALRDQRRRQTVFVIDEAWAVMANLGAARFLQASFKLARAFGVANLLVAHRVSDLAASGAEGSAVARLNEGLLADCETVICHAQAAQEVPACADALGLTSTERSLLPTLGRGVALWHVGAERYLVEHVVGQTERRFVDTDAALISSSHEGERTMTAR